MFYVWGYCEGWEMPEVIILDSHGVYRWIADGEIDLRRYRSWAPWYGRKM